MSNTETTTPDEVEETPVEQKATEETHQSDTTDWKALARKWEQRAKSNKAAADELAALKEAAKSEEQKRSEKIARLEAEVASYKTRDQIKAWSEEIVKDSDIPASVLRGNTREELEAHYEQLQGILNAQRRGSNVFSGFEKEPKTENNATSAWLGQLFGKQ